MKKRLISLLCILAMLATLVAAPVTSAEEEETVMLNNLFTQETMLWGYMGTNHTLG